MATPPRFTYESETNYYSRYASFANATEYDRGGFLTTIDYGYTKACPEHGPPGGRDLHAGSLPGETHEPRRQLRRARVRTPRSGPTCRET